MGPRYRKLWLPKRRWPLYRMRAVPNQKVYDSPVRPALVRLAIACAISSAMCAGCIGRNHTQHEGNYLFTAQEIIRDDCGLQSGSATLWSGVMLISGDLVRMQMDQRLYGMEAVGYFFYGVEGFTMDGSAQNATVQVRGTECQVTLVQAHIDATTDSPRDFHGTTQVQFRETPCPCQLAARYTASLQ